MRERGHWRDPLTEGRKPVRRQIRVLIFLSFPLPFLLWKRKIFCIINSIRKLLFFLLFTLRKKKSSLLLQIWSRIKVCPPSLWLFILYTFLIFLGILHANKICSNTGKCLQHIITTIATIKAGLVSRSHTKYCNYQALSL
jgi:hypothetical protein